jgi:hypothetical protein
VTMKLISYASGEVTIAANGAVLVRLPRERAFRLVMHARMHDPDELAAALPGLVGDGAACAALAARFAALASPSERWAFKEAFARLHTLSRTAPAGDPTEIAGSAEL